MAITTFAKTISGGGLPAVAIAEGGVQRLLLHAPQVAAVCAEFATPYQLPSAEGGFLVLAEYGQLDCGPSECVTPKAAHTTCGPDCCSGNCGGRCGGDASAKPKSQGVLIRSEIVAYSGFDADGYTALITGRGLEKTQVQAWNPGTVVLQVPTGSEFKVYEDRIKALEALGCIAAIPHAMDCENVDAGEWRCYDGCWRFALKDVVVNADADGQLNIPAAGEGATERWSKCHSFVDVLERLAKQFVECKHFDAEHFIVDPKDCTIKLNSERVALLPENSDCYVKGQWHFSNECWRFALQSLKIAEHPFPGAREADEWWSKCYGMLDVLSLLRKCVLDIPEWDGCAVEEGHWRSNAACDEFRYALCSTAESFPETNEAGFKWSKRYSTQEMLGVYNYLPVLGDYFTYTKDAQTCEWSWTFDYKLNEALKTQCLALEEPADDCAEMRDVVVYRDICADGDEVCWKLGLKPITEEVNCIDALPVLPDGLVGQEVVAYADPDCSDGKVKLYVKAVVTDDSDA